MDIEAILDAASSEAQLVEFINHITESMGISRQSAYMLVGVATEASLQQTESCIKHLVHDFKPLPALLNEREALTKIVAMLKKLQQET